MAIHRSSHFAALNNDFQPSGWRRFHLSSLFSSLGPSFLHLFRIFFSHLMALVANYPAYFRVTGPFGAGCGSFAASIQVYCPLWANHAVPFNGRTTSAPMGGYKQVGEAINCHSPFHIVSGCFNTLTQISLCSYLVWATHRELTSNIGLLSVLTRMLPKWDSFLPQEFFLAHCLPHFVLREFKLRV